LKTKKDIDVQKVLHKYVNTDDSSVSYLIMDNDSIVYEVSCKQHVWLYNNVEYKFKLSFNSQHYDLYVKNNINSKQPWSDTEYYPYKFNIHECTPEELMEILL